ncbi:MAG: RAD55 family ATPase [Archaeoglobaceae archaeon]|nr:RAD55 family ATPase [Archaeoglobaceae archaeon]MDW7989734.1 RAD55 family ATPase [Archaeoglobaceae archaeon]
MDYARFGISRLDSYLGGGLDRNTINLLIGRSGIGKTILAAHWAAEGAKNGETVIYISTTMNKYNCKNYLGDFSFMKDLYEKIHWRFIRIEPKYLLPMSKEKVREALEATYGMRGEEVDRVIFDSCTDLEKTLADVVLYRRAIRYMADLAYKYEFTSLWVEEAPMNGTWSDTKNLVETAIFMNILRIPDGYIRAMRILKKYRSMHPLEWFPYEITKEGLIVKEGWYVKKDYDYKFKPSRED